MRRPMAFAGSWYPRDPAECERAIAAFGRSAPPGETARPGGPARPAARLAIAPHAGWMYSGALAARAFAALEPAAEVALVVVLGGHLRAGDAIFAMVDGEWETPFGPFTIHRGFRPALERLPRVRIEREGAWEPDNSTELQLPFARSRFPQAELLPLRVPPNPQAPALGRALAGYLRESGLRWVAIASTDLTHYGPNYDFEPEGRGPQALAWVRESNDAAFIEAAATGQAARILEAANSRHCACSAGAVAALAELREPGETFHRLGYATSADIRPHPDVPRDRRNFVGYLAGVYGEGGQG
ncbi:MAG: AmmeMemoRadiSam system protein B [Candidatus Lambdaproteobacteria bacterium]|nr:AmmeMemoRadiSam system protein B [Candidatus Lambdaproteobacteria bacterium]